MLETQNPIADISDADVSSPYADLAFDINSTTRSDNFETTEVINLLSTFSEAESHDAIPQGTKNDVFFMLRNGNNITNRSNGKKSDFSDDCGVWDKNKGSTPKQFYQQTSNGLRIIFKRDEAYCLDSFPGLAPHGNSKSGELYLRTPASVMTEMSDMLRKDRPLNVYNKLTNKCGVTSGPSNRKQVHDKNYNDKKKADTRFRAILLDQQQQRITEPCTEISHKLAIKTVIDLIVIIEEIETQFMVLAVCFWSRGQYRVADSHKHFEITATSWVNKTVQERERLTKRFKSYIPPDKHLITSTDGRMNAIKPWALDKKIGQRKRKINERTTTFKRKRTDCVFNTIHALYYYYSSGDLFFQAYMLDHAYRNKHIVRRYQVCICKKRLKKDKELHVQRP
ncbi:unnamed protein product [Mytilus coruscus]|uniref:Uncharacterized protein n=1 Tax=Mytilus coruscus TaxID=42192 RepID=A0A6J8D090_MYTCO|nr:unnamed protein product [Mytilus coruscus]